MSSLKDLVGQRFGRLVVIERAGANSNGLATWHCLCDCGNDCIVVGAHLRSGHTKSCGCLHIDSVREKPITHGKSGIRLYAVWASMIQRCYNPKNNRFKYYNGRGITVCDEWRKNFQAFYDWAIANGYDENAPRSQCTIDRIDNNKGYCPDNCRWADMKTQRNNRTDTRRIQNEHYQN